MIVCKKCGRSLPVDETWDLLYIGTFCRDCALFVLAYWAINAAAALKKVQADVSSVKRGES